MLGRIFRNAVACGHDIIHFSDICLLTAPLREEDGKKESCHSFSRKVWEKRLIPDVW